MEVNRNHCVINLAKVVRMPMFPFQTMNRNPGISAGRQERRMLSQNKYRRRLEDRRNSSRPNDVRTLSIRLSGRFPLSPVPMSHSFHSVKIKALCDKRGRQRPIRERCSQALDCAQLHFSGLAIDRAGSHPRAHGCHSLPQFFPLRYLSLRSNQCPGSHGPFSAAALCCRQDRSSLSH
jgi:hypothetical protein